MSRFILGMITGGFSSFSVLNEITERRLANIIKPNESLIHTFNYSRRLRQLIMSENMELKEDTSVLRRVNNYVIQVVAGKGNVVNDIKSSFVKK